MTMLPWNSHPSHRNAHRAEMSFDYPPDDLIADARRGIDSQQSDCCVALAAYQVTIPRAGDRARPTELLLCAHHYRKSRAALVALHALVCDRRGSLVGHASHTDPPVPDTDPQPTTSNEQCDPA